MMTTAAHYICLNAALTGSSSCRKQQGQFEVRVDDYANLRVFERFAIANSGAIAPLFAICLFAVCVASGLAVDYSLGFSAKTKLQAAADAAALAMVSHAAHSNGSDSDIEAAKEKGLRLYADLLSKEAAPLRQPPRVSLSPNRRPL